MPNPKYAASEPPSVDGPTVHDQAQIRFSAVTGAGDGRFGGQYDIAEFTDLRWITIETGPQHHPY